MKWCSEFILGHMVIKHNAIISELPANSFSRPAPGGSMGQTGDLDQLASCTSLH